MSVSTGMVNDRLEKLLSTRLDISHSKTQPGRKGGTITLLEALRLEANAVAKLIRTGR